MTYQFRLQRSDGSPADPPTYRSAVLNWRQGDTIPLGRDRTLRVLGVRDYDADQPQALIVQRRGGQRVTGRRRIALSGGGEAPGD